MHQRAALYLGEGGGGSLPLVSLQSHHERDDAVLRGVGTVLWFVCTWKESSLVLAARGTVQKGKRWKAGEKGSHDSLAGLYLSSVTQGHLGDCAVSKSETTERALTPSCLFLPRNCNQSTGKAGGKEVKEPNKKWKPFFPDRVLPDQ